MHNWSFHLDVSLHRNCYQRQFARSCSHETQLRIICRAEYVRCIGDRRCQSLNFYETTKICELNNRTRIVGHLHFQPREGAFYMENPFRVIVECTGNPCQNGGTCEYQGEGQYTCRCPQGYSGDHCEKGEKN
ncbi:unnamed protein product [Pocillopora meandrina]|uniref:EGF-like domain-containing protein n=1 Tax=Pocillopora meandrina TaxID=46732 RepID=A0AAU9XB40_9CNID|nr:unnamed protein product [Pocillopora meandrina]